MRMLSRRVGSWNVLPDLRVPVIAAPMAGGISTPELVADVAAAGGFGFLPAGYLTATGLSERIARLREISDCPFGVNLFVPEDSSRTERGALDGYVERVRGEATRYGVEAGEPVWDDDDYTAKLEVVATERIPVVSFTFGCPDESTVDRLHAVGSQVVVTVTTPREARQAANAGADVLCVQGMEAGGHRALFVDDGVTPSGGPQYGILAALQLIAAEVQLPLIATGGLVTGADIAAVLAAGAAAAQLGTAFMACPEAGTAAAQRFELAAAQRETAFTRAFSGRPARGMVNRFMMEHGVHAPAAYPELHHLTRPIRGASSKNGDPEAMSLWAGQTYGRTRQLPASDLLALLVQEMRAALDHTSRRI